MKFTFRSTRTLSVALLALSTLALSACDDDERAAALRQKPSVSDLGDIDGCQVKFVNRGYQADSFFIARCGDTSTTTRNYSEQQGKSSVFRRSTVIEQELQEARAHEAAEAEASRVKEQALSKLSPSERKALGIDQ